MEQGILIVFYYLNNKGIDVYVLVLCSTVISFALSYYLTELMRIMNLQILIGEKR